MRPYLLSLGLALLQALRHHARLETPAPGHRAVTPELSLRMVTTNGPRPITQTQYGPEAISVRRPVSGPETRVLTPISLFIAIIIMARITEMLTCRMALDLDLTTVKIGKTKSDM